MSQLWKLHILICAILFANQANAQWPPDGAQDALGVLDATADNGKDAKPDHATSIAIAPAVGDRPVASVPTRNGNSLEEIVAAKASTAALLAQAPPNKKEELQQQYDQLSKATDFIKQNPGLLLRADGIASSTKASIANVRMVQDGGEVTTSLDDGSQRSVRLSHQELRTLYSITASNVEEPSNGNLDRSQIKTVSGPLLGAMVINSAASMLIPGAADATIQTVEDRVRQKDIDAKGYDHASRTLAQVASDPSRVAAVGPATANQAERLTYSRDFVDAARGLLTVPLGSSDLGSSAIYAKAPVAIKDVVQSSMTTLVRNDAVGNGPESDVPSLVKLVSSRDFQGFAQKTLGSEATKKLNLNVAGAVIAALGSVDSGTLKLVKTTIDAQTGKVAGGGYQPSVSEWVEMARVLTSDARLKELKASGKSVEGWLKGRQQLESWLATLASLKASHLLERVRAPFDENFQAEIKRNESQALTSLNRLASFSPKPGEDKTALADHNKLRVRASVTLEGYSASLDDLSGRSHVLMSPLADEQVRDIWRRYEKGNYLIYRGAVGFLAFASEVERFKTSKSYMAVLVKAAFDALQQRQQMVKAKAEPGKTAAERLPAAAPSTVTDLRFDDAD